MKNKILILAFTFFVATLSAQQKGTTPISTVNSKELIVNNTYAVVIGISDYQDPAIPDLQFADKDAEAFANFLRSNAGGKLDKDHLKVLLNKDATAAQFAIALDWLMEVVKENDQVILYFSGHGDVEKKTITQPGYLLCWDAPSRVYLAGGALALPMFQDIITTLSSQNKAKVVVITDACRSGKLAGSLVGGAQITGANLAKQYANEIKILSCQPNEYSIEGEQWGGGRGAFSYNLVNALYGMADSNNDLIVNLQEAGRYLEDHVTAEVAPVSQVPMILGNRSERLANVDASLLASLKSGKSNQKTLLSSIEARGIEDDVLANADTSIQLKYKLFKQALKDKIFLEPANSCADSYYEQLIKEPKLERLHSTMRRNYAAALQDDAQQLMNTILKTGLTSKELANVKAAVVYKNYPTYLERAAELLGNGHYMYATLQARKHYFVGSMKLSDEEKKKSFFQALQWQPTMPHAYEALISTYSATQKDSAEYYAGKAMDIVPAWVRPYISLAFFYQLGKMPDIAEKMLDKAFQLDSNSIFVWFSTGKYYKQQSDFKKAEYWYLKAITGTGEDICFPCAHYGLGQIYRNTGRHAEAEQQFKKAIQLDSTFAAAYNDLGQVYNNTRRYVEAEQHYKKAIQFDSTEKTTYNNFANLYWRTGRYEEAVPLYKIAIQLDSMDKFPYNGLGNVCYFTGRYAEAEQNYKKAIQLDSTYTFSYNGLCNVYLSTHRYTDLESLINLGVRIRPLNPYFPFYLGQAFLALNRMDEAEKQFNKSLALDSNNIETHFQLGHVYNQLKRYDESAMENRKAIKLDPTLVKAYYNLACALSMLNKTDDAFMQLELAIQKGFNKYENIQKDTDLNNLKLQAEKWNALMKKYFP